MTPRPQRRGHRHRCRQKHCHRRQPDACLRWASRRQPDELQLFDRRRRQDDYRRQRRRQGDRRRQDDCRRQRRRQGDRRRQDDCRRQRRRQGDRRRGRRAQRGLTVVSAEIHAVIGAATDIVALVDFVGDVCIVVADAVPVIDIVLPVSTSRLAD